MVDGMMFVYVVCVSLFPPALCRVVSCRVVSVCTTVSILTQEQKTMKMMMKFGVYGEALFTGKVPRLNQIRNMGR